jgi:Na+-translocating ferredoxin:NAD+ oxidoreductase RnfD subunit
VAFLTTADDYKVSILVNEIVTFFCQVSYLLTTNYSAKMTYEHNDRSFFMPQLCQLSGGGMLIVYRNSS